jgi:caffeoyl-CoA O-methyltransferase
MIPAASLAPINEYAASYTTAHSELLHALERETNLQHPQPHMLSGHLQGRLLSMLAKMIRPKCIVEVGTYTGYSALCLAEGLAPDGILHTFEVDVEKETICKKYFDASNYAHQIILYLGDALQNIQNINTAIDLVFIDADKVNYCNYFDAIIEKVSSGGLIIADNVLFHGQVLEAQKGKNAKAVHEYNQKVLQDTRVEIVLLPIRDGLSIARKK